MSKLQDTAIDYLRAGLSVLPVTDKKSPALDWKALQEEPLTEDRAKAIFSGSTHGIGIICGKVSGGLEVIDIDAKYDLTGKLWEELRRLIEDNLPDVYSRLVIASSRSGGYHLYYRIAFQDPDAKQEGNNSNLARRPATEEEKKANPGEKVKVLIETRGEGGYIVASPTPGYSYLQGDPTAIPTITEEERGILFNIARSFNTYTQPEAPKVKAYPNSLPTTGLTPFEDYAQRGAEDMLSRLQAKGWRIVRESGPRIHLLRPGDTDTKSSGNYHTELRTLRIFSSSTEFNADKAYSLPDAFTILEFGAITEANRSLAYRRLLEMGYGEPIKRSSTPQPPTQVKTERITVARITAEPEALPTISTPGEMLKIEDIPTATGSEVLITSPGGPEAEAEILNAIRLLRQKPVRIYIQEQGRDKVRASSFQLQVIINRFADLEEEKGELDSVDIDRFLEEVVTTAGSLPPLERDLFKQTFLEQAQGLSLGITAESLDIALSRITQTKAKENLSQDLKAILSEAEKQIATGEPNKALELLQQRTKEAKEKTKEEDFSKYLIPNNLEEVGRALRDKPPGLETLYKIGKVDLTYPAGALSFVAAGTGHGKTTFLINSILQAVEANPDKAFHFFSYEESAEAITRNMLNTFAAVPLGANNRRIIEGLLSGSGDYVRREHREADLREYRAKEQAFKEILNSGRLVIHYTDLTSEGITELISYLHSRQQIGGIFIDYMQLLRRSRETGVKYSQRQQELKDVCRDLMHAAVETGLPIVLGAQFNREANHPLDLHTSKIGEAGDIERQANLVLGLWDNNKKKLDVERKLEKEMKAKPAELFLEDTMYVTILKNRAGITGEEASFPYNGNLGKIYPKQEPSKTGKPLFIDS
jgi:replicative DNA helicase